MAACCCFCCCCSSNGGFRRLCAAYLLTRFLLDPPTCVTGWAPEARNKFPPKVVTARRPWAYAWTPAVSTTHLNLAERQQEQQESVDININLAERQQEQQESVDITPSQVPSISPPSEKQEEDEEEEERIIEDADELSIEFEYDELLWQDFRGNGTAVCRIAANADGEIPKAFLQQELVKSDLLTNLDMIFHAESHSETSVLKYINEDKNIGADKSDVEDHFDEEEETKVVNIMRRSLENAGFELLDKRDLDLCEALNAGYLLRLSIQPDVKEFEASVLQEFYPENAVPNNETATSSIFEGRVLVFRRGYSEEVTVGRLLLPKLDYLQASIVQKSASIVTGGFARLERKVSKKMGRVTSKARQWLRRKAYIAVDMLPKSMSNFTKSKLGWSSNETNCVQIENDIFVEDSDQHESKNVKILGRYGGSKADFVAAPDLKDAINPFLVCEIDYETAGTDAQDCVCDALNAGQISCEYDAKHGSTSSANAPPMRLLRRVSISNLVDFFSPQSRKDIVRGYFEKARLVEPTYEEVVVVWRPKKKKKKKESEPPKALVEIAEIFGIEDRIPRKKMKKTEKTPPLKIRAFTGVPMANLPAVLPKTKLVFRPADAFVFDTVSLLSFFAVLASQRFDSPKFDILAIVSVSFWIIRTFFRYSNKFARYDLLVNKFLTNRISHRGPGAVKYLSSEAASQRATRVCLLYNWLMTLQEERGFEKGERILDLTRKEVLENGVSEMNRLIACNQLVNINIAETLRDLERFNAIKFDNENGTAMLLDEDGFLKRAKQEWAKLLVV